MKTLMRTMALVLLAATGLGGQSSGEKPQYAYRILMNYIQDKERHAGDPRAAAGILYGLGAVAEAGAALTWFAGDDLSLKYAGVPLDPTVKVGVTAGLGAGGALFLGLGMLVQNAKPADFRAQFNDVLTAPDPDTQNRLAAVSLWTLSESAKSKRVTSAWTGILTPLITSAITVAVNVGTNKSWSDNLVVVNSSQILGIIGGVSQLYTPSDEEYLYMKYQAAISAEADFATGTPVR